MSRPRRSDRAGSGPSSRPRGGPAQRPARPGPGRGGEGRDRADRRSRALVGGLAFQHDDPCRDDGGRPLSAWASLERHRGVVAHQIDKAVFWVCYYRASL